jgi:hypothetical protein
MERRCREGHESRRRGGGIRGAEGGREAHMA